MNDFDAVGVTDVGRIRTLNEDAWYAGEHLVVVADGMGGHAAGDVASALTISALVACDEGGVDRGGLAASVRAANDAVLEHARTHPEAVGLGSTVCGLARTADGWLVFNAGDSRCYVIEKGTLRQVTSDHSEVQELVDNNLISAADARIHPNRNVITRAVGQEPHPVVDFFTVAAGHGARFVLASDGLHSEIDDCRIAEICASTVSARELALALVDAALEAGGHDNVTVIVVDDLSDSDSAGRSGYTTVPRDLIVREVAK
jgi:protein phosphatase